MREGEEGEEKRRVPGQFHGQVSLEYVIDKVFFAVGGVSLKTRYVL